MSDGVTGGSLEERFECLFYCRAINIVVVGQSRTVRVLFSHERSGEPVDATESEDNYLDEEIKEIQHSIHC